MAWLDGFLPGTDFPNRPSQSRPAVRTPQRAAQYEAPAKVPELPDPARSRDMETIFSGFSFSRVSRSSPVVAAVTEALMKLSNPGHVAFVAQSRPRFSFFPRDTSRGQPRGWGEGDTHSMAPMYYQGGAVCIPEYVQNSSGGDWAINDGVGDNIFHELGHHVLDKGFLPCSQSHLRGIMEDEDRGLGSDGASGSYYHSRRYGGSQDCQSDALEETVAESVRGFLVGGARLCSNRAQSYAYICECLEEQCNKLARTRR